MGICLVLGLGLGLAACGGGQGGAPAAPITQTASMELPTIAMITPAEAAPGEAIIISGANLANVAEVWVNGTRAEQPTLLTEPEVASTAADELRPMGGGGALGFAMILADLPVHAEASLQAEAGLQALPRIRVVVASGTPCGRGSIRFVTKGARPITLASVAIPPSVAFVIREAEPAPDPTRVPAPAPASTRTPAPATTRTPAPAPASTRTPAPASTRTPTPAPATTRTPAPASTRTPAPAPASTRTPAPATTRTPAPAPAPTSTSTSTSTSASTRVPAPTPQEALARQARADAARTAAVARATTEGRSPAEIARRGAEAHARAMGLSPSAIAAAGGNAAAEVVAAARTARQGAGTPEGARQGHLAAVALRDANLARNLSFGAYPVMNLTTEYRHAKRAMDAFAGLPPAPDAPRLNLAYLSADPYLVHHNVDIHTLVPEPLTPGEIARMRTILIAATPAAGPAITPASPAHAFDVVDGYVTGPEVRMAGLKRIKRLFDEAQRKQDAGEGPVQDFSGVLPGVTMTPMMELAYDLGQNAGRCIDGVRNGLSDMEKRIFQTDEDAEILHMGEFISQVVADYKMQFLERHAQLDPTNAEFPTMVVQNLRQKMLFSLGLRGSFSPIHYIGVAGSNGNQMDAEVVMWRFLAGEGNVRLAPGSPTVDFPAYDADKLIALMQEARERGFMNLAGLRPLHPDQPGLRMKASAILQECQQPGNETLLDAYTEFCGDPTFVQPYFLPPVAGPAGNDTNTGLTRAFWVHVLRRYGYILPLES